MVSRRVHVVANANAMRNFLRSLIYGLDAILQDNGSPSKTLSTFRRNAWILAVNLASFVAFCVVAFSRNVNNLFLWRDGTYLRVLAKQQSLWGDMRLGFTADVFHGLGNLWLPYNFQLIPGYSLSLIANAGQVEPVVAYIVFSTELFAAAYLLSRALHFTIAISLFSAWLLPLAVMPITSSERVYPAMYLYPNLATLISSVILLILLFRQIGRCNAAASCACIVALGAVLVHMLVTQPLMLILPVPVLLIFGTCAMVDTGSRRELNIKIVTVVAFVAALFLSGAIEFQYGLYRSTAAVYFASELLNNRADLYSASILFQNAVHSFYGPVLFILGMVGASIVAVCGTSTARIFARGSIASATLIVSFGLLCAVTDFWRGPVACYFEFFLWPFYTLFSTITLAIVVLGIFRLLHGIGQRWIDRWAAAVLGLKIGDLAIAILPWLIFFYIPNEQAPSRIAFVYPPSSTPITEWLRREIGLKPGGTYLGRVATFTGQTLNHPIGWPDLALSDYLNSVGKYNNDHRMEGFWYFDIPTLAELSQFITPPFYLVMRQFFARPGDSQIRNVMTLRDINPRILRMLGVRFFVIDAPTSIAAKRRVRMINDEGKELLLYELDNVNVGQYSPVDGIVVLDAGSALNTLARPDFDPTRQVVVNDPLPVGLIPSLKSEIRVMPGELQIFALSTRTSIMLLPFEYSRCLNLATDNVGAVAPKLFRANLLQTGVLFSGRLNATLRFSTGPFQNADCRMKDIEDMKRLNIAAEVKLAP